MMRALAILVCLGCLLSCTTVATLVEHADTNYNRQPVTLVQGFMKRSISLGEYSLVLDRSIREQREAARHGSWTEYDKRTGGVYLFSRGGSTLCTVEIYRKFHEKTDGKSSMSTGESFVRIVRDTATEYTISDMFGSDAYLSISEGGHAIGVSKYYRDESGKSGGIFAMVTGFSITADGKDYGILALYKTAALYELKAAATDDRSLRDAVSLAALAAYESSLQQKSGF